MYATGGVLIGIFAAFITIQQQLRLGIPWYARIGGLLTSCLADDSPGYSPLESQSALLLSSSF